MKWQPKNIQETLFPIIILNWFAGLTYLEYPLGKPRPILTFIHIFSNFTVYLYAMYNDPFSYIHDANELRKAIFKNFKYINLSIAIFSIILGWYNYKTYKTSIQRMESIDEALDFTFTSIVNYIGLRFDSINSLLNNIFAKKPKPITVNQSYSKDRQKSMKLIILVRNLHVELSEISVQVNKMYQMQMTMAIASYLTVMTAFLYAIFSILFLEEQFFYKNVKAIVCSSVWCTVYFYRFFNLNSTCAQVTSKSRETKIILYEMKDSIEDVESKNEIEQFCLQLTLQPLVFTACGLSTFDYNLIKKFIGTVTTYLVILINMTPKIPD